MKIRKPLFCALTMCSLFLGSAQAQSSDNGDGTFTNPMLWSDVHSVIITADITLIFRPTTSLSEVMYILPPTLLKRNGNWFPACRIFTMHPCFSMMTDVYMFIMEQDNSVS